MPRTFSLKRAMTVLAVVALATGLVVGCGGSGSGGANGNGCFIGGGKCAYGCSPNVGCTECVSNADCDGGKPACVLGKCQECGAQAGCGAAEVCFPRDAKCHAPCAVDGDCPTDSPICLVDSGVCVGCVSNADCGSGKDAAVCEPNRAQCSACAADVDCGAANPVCDLNDGTCHQCLVDAHCRAPEVCGVNRKCHAVCTSNLDCKGEEPFCDVSSGECLACLGNDQCAAPTPTCRDGKCVACQADVDCLDPLLPICKGEKCVQCDKDEDCPDPALSKCDKQQCVAP